MTKQKSKRRVIIIVAVVLTALISIAGGVFLFMSNQQKNMNALETGEFLPGIYALNCDFVNMFLIDCGGSYIAVDAGGDKTAVERGLVALGISSDDVTAVLMTHSHGDHTAGLNLFEKAVVFKAVSDGDTNEINGKTIQVIGTPGHAEDSVCYLIDGEYLFVGDNLSLKDGKVGLFNSVYNKSDEQQKADIAKLADITEARYVISAHYGFAEKPMFP